MKSSEERFSVIVALIRSRSVVDVVIRLGEGNSYRIPRRRKSPMMDLTHTGARYAKLGPWGTKLGTPYTALLPYKMGSTLQRESAVQPLHTVNAA
jgi:hypothetical protein